jgi:hypothetical protein
MTEFMLINHGVGLPEKWDAFFTMLSEGGHMIEGSSLEHLMSIQGGVVSEDHSSAATGYTVFQAKDLTEAKEIMRQCPVHQNGGTVQLFTFN